MIDFTQSYDLVPSFRPRSHTAIITTSVQLDLLITTTLSALARRNASFENEASPRSLRLICGRHGQGCLVEMIFLSPCNFPPTPSRSPTTTFPSPSTSPFPDPSSSPQPNSTRAGAGAVSVAIAPPGATPGGRHRESYGMKLETASHRPAWRDRWVPM